MIPEEFNNKWKKHLAEGFYGLNIHNPSVTAYLDELFTILTKQYPDFTFYQIKTKFDSVRFYADNIPTELKFKIEKSIKEILSQTRVINYFGKNSKLKD